MQNDANTNETDNRTQRLDMDFDDWDLALKPYEGNPSAALLLGYNVAILRTYLDAQTIKCRKAIEALDQALEVLFPYTDFHHASFDLFIRLAEGKLTFEEEQMLNALGVKF